MFCVFFIFQKYYSTPSYSYLYTWSSVKQLFWRTARNGEDILIAFGDIVSEFVTWDSVDLKKKRIIFERKIDEKDKKKNERDREPIRILSFLNIIRSVDVLKVIS